MLPPTGLKSWPILGIAHETYKKIQSLQIKWRHTVTKLLKNLEVLNMGFNLIETIPESIGELKNLQYISLEDNKINKLPKSMANLNKLEVIQAAGNPIGDIAREIQELPNLKRLVTEND